MDTVRKINHTQIVGGTQGKSKYNGETRKTLAFCRENCYHNL